MSLKCYEQWSTKQMQEGPRCRVEHSISCIPLRSDPICYACFELDSEVSEVTDE
jgi:hypothetical protein